MTNDPIHHTPRYPSTDVGRAGAPLSRRAVAARQFVVSVYRWMALGLLLTAGVAWWVAGTPRLVAAIAGNPILFYGLIIGELGLVIGLSAGIRRLSARAATGLFLFYSALNGATLSVILLAYTTTSIAQTFVVAGTMFGAMAVYGSRTRRDLTAWRGFLVMGLIGVLAAFVVNIFIQSSMVGWIASGIGVVVFTGLAAYDAQKIKRMGEAYAEGDAPGKWAVIGALSLYLDFINLFLMLLRFLGDRR